MKRVVMSISRFLAILLVVSSVFNLSGYVPQNILGTSVKNIISKKEEVEEKAVTQEEVTEQEPVQVQEVSYTEPVYNEPVVETSSNRIIIPNVLNRDLMHDDSGNHFYLDHGINGNYDGIGVPYSDFRTDFSGRKTIVYAHSSLAGNGPFNPLQNYHNSYGFYTNNRYITIQYQGNTYTYEIFSVYVSLANDEESEGLEYFHRMNYSDEEWQEALNRYKSHSEYDTGVSVNNSDKILILQTCSMDPNYYEKYYRYNLLIMAKLV